MSEAEQTRFDSIKSVIDQMDELTDIALPAGPTKTCPDLSSLSPGSSPMSITFGCVLPSPNTVCVAF